MREAHDKDIQIALDKKYEDDRAQAEALIARATEDKDVNLANATRRALAGTRTELDDFLREGQYNLDLHTSFEPGDVTLPSHDTPAWDGSIYNSDAFLGLNRNVGQTHTGSAALEYFGSDQDTTQSFAYLRVVNVSRVTIKPTTTLSYWIYPQAKAEDQERSYNSTCVAVDLTFSDGSFLRNSGATDQRGNRAHPAHQCGKLIPRQWNHVVVPLGEHLSGTNVTQLNVGYEQPGNTGFFHGYIDDIAITDQPVAR
jgi:hypothetical protein